MPISPIVLQRRHAELGRIRLGHKAATQRGGTRPAKLDTFRFTSPSERYIRDLAELYGGEAQAWDNNGMSQWEVFTTAKTIPVIAVKGGLSQWMETWSGGGVAHRCDGEHQVDGTPCDPSDPAHVNAKPTTRLSVMLPELEAIGVWRLETHGWNAAAEIPAVAELATYVGDLVPAHLHLVERRAIQDGKTSRFVVPVLDLQIGTARLKALVAEKSGTAALEGPATGAPALDAAPGPDYGADIEACATVEDVRALWKSIADAGHLTEETAAALTARAEHLKTLEEVADASGEGSWPVDDDPVDAEVVEDADPQDRMVAWQQLLAAAGEAGIGSAQLAEDVRAWTGKSVQDCTAADFSAALHTITTGEAPEAVSA